MSTLSATNLIEIVEDLEVVLAFLPERSKKRRELKGSRRFFDLESIKIQKTSFLAIDVGKIRS